MAYKYKQAGSGFFWVKYYRDGRCIRKSLKTKDSKTADYLIAKIEQELIEGTLPPTLKDQAFQEVFDEYLAYSKGYKTKKSYDVSYWNLQPFFDAIKPAKLKDITTKVIESYLLKRIQGDDKKIKPVTANDILRALKAFLNWCVKRNYLFKNPAEDIRAFSEPELPPRFLTNEEITALWDKAKDNKLHAFIATALFTGMRPGEIFNLEWPDIDFKHNKVSVLNKPGFQTKTRKFRIIPLTSELKAILVPIRQEKGHIFDGVRKNYRKNLKSLLDAAKIKTDVRALRHTYASHLVSNGVSLYIVSKLLGHASVKTTEKHYARLSTESLENAVGKLDYGHIFGHT